VEDCEEAPTCAFNDPPEGFRILGQDAQQAYLLSDKKANWANANKRCQEIGGQLVRIDHGDEQKFLIEKLKASGVSTAFIGLSDPDLDGLFEWTNGGELDFQNWADGHPFLQNKSGGVYLGAWSGGPWYLTHFLTEKNYICEQRCSTPENFKLNYGGHSLQSTRVYPNPVEGNIQVEATGYSFDQLRLLRSDGQMVQMETYPPETQITGLSLAHQAPGLYFLRIRMANGDWVNKRIVKN
jgi:hypothetical protein